MKGVNAGVNAWNWTTGRTRAELANFLLGSNIAILGAGAVLGNEMLEAAVALSYLMVNEEKMEFNHDLDYLEMKAADNHAKNMSVEREKERMKRWGEGYLVAAACTPLWQHTVAKEYNPIADSALSLSFATVAASNYVMRADYLPPRKDCVRRGLEKFAEKLKEIEIPSPLPEPVPVGAAYEVI